MVEKKWFAEADLAWNQAVLEMIESQEAIGQKFRPQIDKLANESVADGKELVRQVLSDMSEKLQINGRPLQVRLENLDAFTRENYDVNRADAGIEALYGIDSPIFDDLDGARARKPEDNDGTVEISLDAKAVLKWQGDRMKGAKEIGESYQNFVEE